MTRTESDTQITQLIDQLQGKSAEEVLRFAAEQFAGKIAFASSLGQEDQVITDMICRLNLPIPIFTLDTGRLFPETYELIARTEKKYNTRLQVYFPQAEAVQEMVSEKGVNLFYESIENRKQCCKVRKLEPLKRALSGVDVWICGLRREQAVTRADMQVAEWDGLHSMPKLNPLIDWSTDQMLDYIKQHDVPYNPLHDQGFISIGCAPCTRAVKPGQHLRDGRWWWETPEQKECGLHIVDGKAVRTKDLTPEQLEQLKRK